MLSRLRRAQGYGGFFSSARTLSLPVGRGFRPGQLRGYYIDFRLKAESPHWPPSWFDPTRRHVVPAQWGLGAYERHLAGEGEEWLAAALGAADHLVSEQERGGPRDGAWLHQRPMPHTYRLPTPWVSAMAQGEGASLLVRAHASTGEERYADAARRALSPLAIAAAAGGARAELGGGFFLEEYPTDPPSLVLNGAIFALWGYYDVALALRSRDAQREFEEGVGTLVREIDRWDTGWWSRYDLFPWRSPNLASSGYHLLHINQLRAMAQVAGRPELARAADRFDAYQRSRANRARAFGRKVLFRLLVPRNRLLAQRSPFAKPRAQPSDRAGVTASPSG